MKNKIIGCLLTAMVAVGGCAEDFLEKPPIDQLTDETYWTTEENVRTFAWGFYSKYFTGYGTGWTWGSYFAGQSLNDDFSPTTPPQYRLNPVTASTATYYNFNWVRKANIFIDRIQTVPMEEGAINHWLGVARFFRAMEYSNMVNQFGDVPWIGEEVNEGDQAQIYRPRDPRAYVMDRVLEDFQFAAENVRVSDGVSGLTVNKDVVLAFMSRAMLFEGTWQKYHEGNNAKASEYLEAAKWAADEVIGSGRYSLTNYRETFTSINLAGNPEVIMYRHYEPGMLSHSLMSYNNFEPQTGVSKNAIDSYLMADGLPISLSPNYQGDRTREEYLSNRDGRMYETFVTDEYRVNGIIPEYSTSGISTHKFLNESIRNTPEGSSNLNIIDAPVIRYGEVLMNYVEAAAELGSLGGTGLTQDDVDKTINVLRARPGIDMPAVQVAGDQFSVNGVPYQDPNQDQSVSPLIWEIRRERRIELMMEGFRLNDLRRWKKMEYTDTRENPTINRGAWIRESDFPGLQSSVVLSEGNEGYIIPAPVEAAQRVFNNPRVYLDPIPIDQIALYRENGVTLEQNPGW
ncbi:RagB/SusD family nutrient uptake outer membrane protein [Litoribacter alkaliphilus]|uniref:RagB/SusD family nutrient uptake outer membrane protein n=1 Tax=Litoribacter ruber TaxID=702568 RepID=A0AAP2CK39_9BACT|nr:RagB/SusD family nutrient uptake outer membrane protein [Litoribacter alkaliphilus]MBS9525415.1 RagB/SusD family nutrient uptake outer membrane protein [Litoribacter alkaliphilus]